MASARRGRYLELGVAELQRRAAEAVAALASCEICPRNCRVDRLADEARVCATGRYARASTWFAHFGEEDCLRGRRGSGTLFFSACNLKCVFCQNHDISQATSGRLLEPAGLAAAMLELQAQGCHNLNLVTPEHVVPQILEALPLAVERGLTLPIVYNTSAYDSRESLAWFEGVADVYLPDFKLRSRANGIRYLKAKDYGEVAGRVIQEMHRQVGPLKIDEATGLATSGVLVRHLVMPGLLDESRAVFEFLAREVSRDTYVNIMAQYRPEYRAAEYPEIARAPTREEMSEALASARAAGLWRFDRRRPGHLPVLG